MDDTSNLLTAVAAIGSVITSSLAFWLSRKQLKMHENHNRLSVTPHLDGMVHIDEDDCIYRYSITNNGIGPAIIKRSQIYVNGQYSGSTEHLENALPQAINGIQSEDFGHEHRGDNAFIPAGDTIPLITINCSRLNISPSQIRQQLADRATLVLEYESIYGDKFLFNSSD